MYSNCLFYIYLQQKANKAIKILQVNIAKFDDAGRCKSKFLTTFKSKCKFKK